mgnify:CR=1 FL=1
MYAGAKDEKEQARLRSKIYMPPKGEGGKRRPRPAATRMSKGDARSFMAAAAAQEAQATRGGG